MSKSPCIKKINLLITKFNYNVLNSAEKRQESIDDAIIYYGIEKLVSQLRQMSMDIKYTVSQQKLIKLDLKWMEKRYIKKS